jgi:hypothetical protein
MKSVKKFDSFLKFTLFITLFYFPILGFSQEIENQKPWVIKLNAFALIDDSSFPTVEFAIEKRIKKYYSLQLEAGLQFYETESQGHTTDTLNVKVGGYRLRVEGRYYFLNYIRRDKRRIKFVDGLFLGVQGIYRKNKYNESFEYDKNPYSNYFPKEYFVDSFGVIKTVYGINGTFGFQLPIHNFIIEPQIFLGAVYRKIENINRIYPYDPNERGTFFEASYRKNLSEFSGLTPNVAIGLHFGYRF